MRNISAAVRAGFAVLAGLAAASGQAPAARECMDYILEKEAANHPVYENLVKCDGF